MGRPLTREELEDMGLGEEQIREILARQEREKPRRYKHVAFLTDEEAEEASQVTGRKFVRATEYTNRDEM